MLNSSGNIYPPTVQRDKSFFLEKQNHKSALLLKFVDENKFCQIMHRQIEGWHEIFPERVGIANNFKNAFMQDNLISVVMPVYNEEKTLAEIARRVLQIPGLLELIIVDDASTDGTALIAQSLAAEHSPIRYLCQSANGGKTRALKSGFVLSGGQIVIVQDADLEYDPREIADVVAPIIEGVADVVYGSRFRVKRAARVLYFYHYLGNKFLTFFSNCLTNLNLTDVECCYKAFRGEIIRNMKITSSGFGFEIEATAKVAKLGCSIYEVPISYFGRTYAEGKKVGFKDGIAALWYIVYFNLLVGLKNSFIKKPKI